LIAVQTGRERFTRQFKGSTVQKFNGGFEEDHFDVSGILETSK
jgi:hypothetical protein